MTVNMRDQPQQPSLIGICNVWLKNVRLLGYVGRENPYIPAGTVGDMNVTEMSANGHVIHARFYRAGERGFGSVVLPKWEYLQEAVSEVTVVSARDRWDRVTASEPTCHE